MDVFSNNYVVATWMLALNQSTSKFTPWKSPKNLSIIQKFNHKISYQISPLKKCAWWVNEGTQKVETNEEWRNFSCSSYPLVYTTTMSECKSFIFTLIISHVLCSSHFSLLPFISHIKHGCCANVEFASMITFFPPLLSVVFTRFSPKWTTTIFCTEENKNWECSSRAYTKTERD